MQTLAIIAAGVLAVSGCSNVSAMIDDQPSLPSSVVKPNVKNPAKVEPGTRIEFGSKKGWLVTDGTFTSENGQVSMITADWRSDPLPPSGTWNAEVVSRNIEGDEVKQSFTFETKAPAEADKLVATLGPDGGTYGVGQTVTATFNYDVPERDRPAIEDRIDVKTSKDIGPAGWWWLDSKTAVYRPKEFWPARTKVRVSADLKNVPVRGPDKGQFYWGTRTEPIKWQTGREFIVYIDGATASGKVEKNGKVISSFGVSLGKPGYTTRSGIKTITDTHYVQRMTNEGVTTEEVYDLQVPYAMRITSTGEFLHAAPWNGNIGYANTSHGCTNLTYSTAQWMFGEVLWGDPVVTTGTGRSMEYWNGPGAVWNVPWKEWKAPSYTPPKKHKNKGKKDSAQETAPPSAI